MYLMPLLATLMSSVFAGALPMVSRNLGHRGVAVFSIFCLIIAFISSALIWIDLYIGSSPVWLDLFGPWFEVGTVTVSWIFYYDLLTAHMLFTVTSVSLAVHIFAVVYMRSDPHLSLFMSYLSLFTFFMLVYVCGDNLLVMLVGWEGIGICSYLLIGYYSHRLAAVKSAQKAILVNRVSDGMLLWGVLWIWYYTGCLEYDLVLLNQTSSISMFIVISVLIGAMGKSAQILFHVWLADAMEGPTPVSALIHAATLVTAGIYLMVRLGPFMAGSDLVILVGCCTAFMAGVFGFFQADLKRVIAFSTCSQLGCATQSSIKIDLFRAKINPISFFCNLGSLSTVLTKEYLRVCPQGFESSQVRAFSGGSFEDSENPRDLNVLLEEKATFPNGENADISKNQGTEGDRLSRFSPLELKVFNNQNQVLVNKYVARSSPPAHRNRSFRTALALKGLKVFSPEISGLNTLPGPHPPQGGVGQGGVGQLLKMWSPIVILKNLMIYQKGNNI
jgi:hypothetical protein